MEKFWIIICECGYTKVGPTREDVLYWAGEPRKPILIKEYEYAVGEGCETKEDRPEYGDTNQSIEQQ